MEVPSSQNLPVMTQEVPPKEEVRSNPQQQQQQPQNHDAKGDHCTMSLSRSSASSVPSQKAPVPSSPPVVESPIDEHYAWKLGTPVWISRNASTARWQGVVAHVGPVQFDEAPDWIGIRLTGPSVGQGKNNGTVHGQTYFAGGPAQSGLFVKGHRLQARQFARTTTTPTPRTSSHSQRPKALETQVSQKQVPVPSTPDESRRRRRRTIQVDPEQDRYEALQRWKQERGSGHSRSSVPLPPPNFPLGLVIEIPMMVVVEENDENNDENNTLEEEADVSRPPREITIDLNGAT